MEIPLKLEVPIHNDVFSAVVFSIFGWILVQTWLVIVDAAIVHHALIAFMGVSLVAIAGRRYLRHWPALPMEQQRPKGTRLLFDAGWCLLLLVTGVILGQFLLAGWIFPLTIVAFSLTCVPWSRISMCRKHFLISVIIVGTPAASSLFVLTSPPSPISLLTGGWVFWAVACYSLLRRS
jgi:hypothetical protein